MFSRRCESMLCTLRAVGVLTHREAAAPSPSPPKPAPKPKGKGR